MIIVNCPWCGKEAVCNASKGLWCRHCRNNSPCGSGGLKPSETGKSRPKRKQHSECLSGCLEEVVA